MYLVGILTKKRLEDMTMKRDLSKAIREYEKLFGGRGIFYTSDYLQLRELSKNEDGSIDPAVLVDNAMMAAFTIGCRKGKREK